MSKITSLLRGHRHENIFYHDMHMGLFMKHYTCEHVGIRNDIRRNDLCRFPKAKRA